MNLNSVKVSAVGGVNINYVIEDCKKLANFLDEKVELQFNNVRLKIYKDSDVAELLIIYKHNLDFC